MEIKIVQNILASNEAVAKENSDLFAAKKILVLNLMSSPGSGKTMLLDKTLEMLTGQLRVAVVEGDISTTLDAERLARHDIQLVQINTDTVGGHCHLEASMLRAALPGLDLDALDILFVENVGNLVCPADFGLGEDLKVVLLSTTEGEDKPLKYPLMFNVCGIALLTKIDLESVLDFSVEKGEANIKQVNPEAKVIRLSAKTGQGMDEWINLLKDAVKSKKG